MKKCLSDKTGAIPSPKEMNMKLKWLILFTSFCFPLSLFCKQISQPFDICPCYSKMDQQTQKLLKTLNAENVSLDEASLRALQENPPFVETRKIPQVKKIINIEIPAPLGAIKARLYYPHKEEPLPVFVFFH